MIYLVAPDPASFTSGGNRFNQQILNGLSFLGNPVNRIEFEEVDDSISVNGNTLIFDSLFLNRISVSELNKIKATKIFLIHFLPSMLEIPADSTHEQNVLVCFDMIIANSLFTRDYILKNAGVSNPVVIIQPFIEKKDSFKKESAKHKFIHVANWIPEKQVDLFLTELTKHKLPPDLFICFYGDLHRSEEYFKQCNSILDTCPMLKEHIQLINTVSYPILQKEYAKASLLIDTSSMETYGMAVAEAIVHRVPVISLGNGNTKNLVNENNGLVCRNMEELVLSIIRYFRGDLSFDHMDTSDITTDWIQFTDQLKQIV